MKTSQEVQQIIDATRQRVADADRMANDLEALLREQHGYEVQLGNARAAAEASPDYPPARERLATAERAVQDVSDAIDGVLAKLADTR